MLLDHDRANVFLKKYPPPPQKKTNKLNARIALKLKILIQKSIDSTWLLSPEQHPCGSAVLRTPSPTSRCPRRGIKFLRAKSISSSDRGASWRKRNKAGSRRHNWYIFVTAYRHLPGGTRTRGHGQRHARNRRLVLHNVNELYRRLVARMALFYISNNGGYELA